ncbi:MAG: rubrerythrin [Eubacteriaceae bacterium]|jgi:rubrerythrin
MGRLAGTQTLKNLMKAFVGESQARMRYTYFSKEAYKGGYKQISDIFNETAENETQHAKMFYRYIAESEQGPEGQPVELEVSDRATYPVALTADTYVNLVNAANGEKDEWGTLYPAFAEDARKEGFEDIAATFNAIVLVEKHHEERYRKLADNVKQGIVFKRPEKTTWRCLDCGYTVTAYEAPKICPVCGNPQRDFEIADYNY